MNLFEHAATAIPVDSIVKGRALDFVYEEGQGLKAVYGGVGCRIHKHALQQIAAKAGVPGAYLAGLVDGEHAWQKALASTILDRHFHDGAPQQRFLARATQNELRGFLSDRYRRLDSRPLLEKFAETCQEVGAVPVDGHVTDTRLALKAVLPMVFEPVAGEVMCLGVEWGNSDYGAAKHAVRAFILRLTCLNGATMEDSLAQVHLGGRLAEDIQLSQRTYDLDTRASVSALGDIVKGVLGPARVNTLLAGIKAADEKHIEWKGMRTQLARRLLKNELQAVEAAYQSEDVINLPPGKTLWRASNAVSWVAGKTESEDRKLELQRIAGEVLNGRRDAEDVAA